MSNKILVTGSSVRQDLLQPLVAAGYLVNNPTHLLSEEELGQALEGCAAYLLGGDEIATRAALARAQDLRVVAFLGVGYESFVDANAARELGIHVTNTPGTLTNSVAEFTVGLALSATRRLFLYATAYAQGQSGGEEKQHDLSALTVGIVGLGAIGTRIAQILRHGFGTRVAYYSRTRKPGVEQELGLAYMALDELVRSVDVLVIMTPGNDQTKGLVGREQVAAARPGLVLVNTARPEVVDPEALLDGLRAEQVGYAAFDGFYQGESETEKDLKSYIPTKLMVTGHIGSLTHEARDGMAKKAVNSILSILTAGDDPYVVNRAK